MSTTVSNGVTSVISTDIAGVFDVVSGGTLRVVSGGSVDATVDIGGQVFVSNGGTATGELFDGGVMTVSAGGLASSENLVAGVLTVSAGGSASGTQVGSRSLLAVSGGIVQGTTIDTSGTETVFSGGRDENAVVSSGAFVVSSGGSAIDTTLMSAGAVISAGGSAVISSGGTELVAAFGSAVGVTLEQGANLIVSSAAVASAFEIAGSAATTLDNGATIVSSVIAFGGSLSIGAGAIDSGNIVNSGGIETVLAGGVASGTRLFSLSGSFEGGTLDVAAGGVASGTGLGASSTLLIEAGGTATNPVDLGLASIIVDGTLSAMLSGFSAEFATLEPGGTIDYQGPLVFPVVASGASLSIGPGQETEDLTVESGGSAVVVSGGLESGAAILSGGVEIVSSGGSAGNASSGTVVSGHMVVSAGGTAYGTTVDPGGVLTVSSGGLAIDTIGSSGSTIDIASGGTELVYGEPPNQVTGSGGDASSITVLSGGNLIVSAGPLPAEAVTVQNGGTLTIDPGNTAEAVQLQAGGVIDVASGGLVAGVNIFAGAALIVSNGGSAFLPIVNSGGVLDVGAGGFAQNVAVGVGGFAAVSSGGVLDVGGISGGGGFLVISPGAAVEGGLAFAGFGARIVIDGLPLPNVPLKGFGAGDELALLGIPYDPNGSVVSSGGFLTLSANNQTYSFALVSASISNGGLFQFKSTNGDTVIEVACFAAGTRIATPSGAAPVEGLRPGDAVLALADGAWRPARVRWVGCTTVDLARHPRPPQAAPIRIRADAFAEGVPHRDLLVSPDHAILVDGVLMQAQSLRNGATVTQEFPPRVTYWHVELDRHAVLCAEGLPAESYLDTGNRALFTGEMGARPLHPDLAAAAAWDARACTQLHLAGPLVAAAHARLLLRAAALGWQVVADPALRILADARDVLVFADGGRGWHATLPAGTREVRLLSRRFVPAWFADDDRRQLGVAVRRLRLAGRSVPHAAFASGWHAQEREWRWTDGEAVLTLQPLPRPARLSLTLADAGARYWLDVPASALSTAGARGIGATAP